MRGEFFHILNRGVEKRKIFYSEKDYLRFTYNLGDFNTTQHAIPFPRRRKNEESGYQSGHPMSTNREKIVDLFCWCLMPNHSHNLVQEIIDWGAGNFSKKVFGGYTKYINENYQRNGVLFQGGSKIIRIQNDPHFFYSPFYMMANPIKLIEPEWKEKGIKNLDKVVNFLENYRWSSFLDLTGKENFPSLINKNLFYEIFGTNEKKFKDDFIEWIGGHRQFGGHPMST